MTRWYRNSKQGKLGGVCAGLSEMWNIDVTLIRFAWFMMIWTPFPSVTAYFIAWFIVPDKESNHANNTVNTATTNTSSSGGKEFLAG
jgi:phage shock protein PspC (stress-responsive transcriptional regulator)